MADTPNIISQSKHLQEKWKDVIDHKALPGITDPYKRAVTAMLLENQVKDLAEQAIGSAGFANPSSLLSEAAPTNNYSGGNIQAYDPILISLVRRSMPNLISYDIMGVQPMSGPTGLIFAFKSRYTNQTGTEALFNEANTAFSATAKGNNAHQSANSQYSGQTGTDPTLLSAGTEYTRQTGFNTAFAEKLGDNAGNAFQEMAFSIGKVTVTAVSRALKAEYTIELAQDLKALHGLDAENELSNILTSEILAELNREAVRTVYVTATIGAQQNVATAGTFDLDVDANGRWSEERFKGLVFEIGREAGEIARATRRGKGNILITSSDVAEALNMAGKMSYTPEMNNRLQVDDTGNTFAGVLNGGIRVYIDPYAISSAGNHPVVVGYKGSSPFDAGLFYCPYVPLQLLRAVGENTFQPKIAFKTRYGMVANPFATTAADGVVSFANKNTYYRRFTVANLM